MIDDRRDRIDPDRPKLLWEQVYEDLAADIQSGLLPPRSRIPGEHDLVERYGVSRPTVHRALVELVNVGLAITVKNKGRYVSEDAQSGDTGN